MAQRGGATIIHSIALNNFQSHKHSVLTFTHGVNVIVGPSDVGKTSIIRALRWVIHNRPAGTEFISHWAKEASVTLNFTDASITRMRGERNVYIVDRVELAGFGQEVPFEVIDATNMNEINIQYQLDGPFLLDESPGAVARSLNQIVKLDVIDLALKNVARYETEVKREAESLKKQRQQIEAELSLMPDFDSIDKIVLRVATAEQRKKTLEYSRKNLIVLIKDIDFQQTKMDNIVIPQIDFTKLDIQTYNLQKLYGMLDTIKKLVESTSMQEALLQKLEKEIEQWMNKFKSLCPNQCPLCGQPMPPTLFHDACFAGDAGL